MSGLLKNIVVIGICIGCASSAYYFFTSSDSELDMSANSAVRLELISKTESFIERSARLQSINIDQSFFTNRNFTSLRSFSTAVPNQPLGRNNIFGANASISTVPSTESEE